MTRERLVGPSRALTIARAHPALILVGCAFANICIYGVAFTWPYSVERGLAQPLTTFPGLTGLAPLSVAAYVAAVCALFTVYAMALRVCASIDDSMVAMMVVIGGGALAALVLLPMYPAFSLDVFYYMAADRIWSIYGENPFLVPPLQASHDPFFPYTSWGHYPLPYGPLWPWVTAITGGNGHGDLLPTLLAFKALGVVGYVLCLPGVAWLVRSLGSRRVVFGLCIFAWNPLVLIELAGNAHNDAIALAPAALALGFWARKRSTSAALLFTVSFLVKATALIVAAPLLWPGIRQAWAAGRMPRWTASVALPCLALILLAWTPFWSWGQPVSFLREADQRYQSITTLIILAVPAPDKMIALRLVQGVLLSGLAAYVWRQRRRLESEGAEALRAVWAVSVLYFAVVSPFYSSWYAVWPTMLAAGIADRRTTRLTALLGAGSLAAYLVQFVVVPAAGASIGWAQLNLLAILTAFGPFLVDWLLTRRPASAG